MMIGISKHWKAPAGLDRSRPRRVRLTSGGIGLIVAGVSLLIGSGAATIGLTRVVDEQREERRVMREEGVDAEAVVSRLWRKSGESRPRWAAYTFSFQGRKYAGEAKAQRREWEQLKVGSTLPVRFLTTNPAMNVPIGWERNAMPGWLPALVGFAMFTLGLLSLVPIRRQYHLLSEGRASPAIVTGHKKHGKATEVLYEFQILSGASIKGHGIAGQVATPVGSAICVLCDSENPHRNAMYPLSLVRLGDI